MRAPRLEGVAKFSIYVLFLFFNLHIVVGPDLQEIQGCTSPFSAVFHYHLALAQAGGWAPTAGDSDTVDQSNTGTPFMNSWVLEAVNSTGHCTGRALPAAHSDSAQCHLPHAALHTLDGTKTQTWAVETVGTWAQESGCVILQCSHCLQPHRTQVPHPAPGMGLMSSPGRQAGEAEQPTHPGCA